MGLLLREFTHTRTRTRDARGCVKEEGEAKGKTAIVQQGTVRCVRMHALDMCHDLLSVHVPTGTCVRACVRACVHLKLNANGRYL